MTAAGEADLVEASFGQGKVVVTPWAMCMVAAALGNDGEVMQPYLVEQVDSPRGSILQRARPTSLGQFITPETAARMRSLMREVVASGTGKKAQVSWLDIAAKTGTAQNPAGEDHAWFVSFAPAGQPRAAMAVVLEHAGAGGVEAARATRNVMPTIAESR
jgi:peptidoglycan glycosyltransferase